MNKQNEFNYKLNSKGEIDLEYYLDLGHQLRAEHLGDIFSDIKAWCGSHLNFPPKDPGIYSRMISSE